MPPYRKAATGYFHPKNTDKYKGKIPITYRSGLEYKLMVCLDLSPKILQWGSESVVVNYFDPTRPNLNGSPSIHRYFIDFYFISFDRKTGANKKYYIEVKPSQETKPPVRGNKKMKTYENESITYVRNVTKWKAAIAHAKKMGGEFKIFTEQDISVVGAEMLKG
jgi:hypothetical protein